MDVQVKAKTDAQTTYSIPACAVNHSDQVQIDVNMINNTGDSALDVHSTFPGEYLYYPCQIIIICSL